MTKRKLTGVELVPAQTRWSGHDGLARRAEGLPPGPESLAELFAWPASTASRLSECEKERVLLLVSDGVGIYSDYSGMDTFRECFELTLGAITESTLPDVADYDPSWLRSVLTFARACDYAPTPQAFIAKHVFTQAPPDSDLSRSLARVCLAFSSLAGPMVLIVRFCRRQ